MFLDRWARSPTRMRADLCILVVQLFVGSFGAHRDGVLGVGQHGNSPKAARNFFSGVQLLIAAIRQSVVPAAASLLHVASRGYKEYLYPVGRVNSEGLACMGLASHRPPSPQDPSKLMKLAA